MIWWQKWHSSEIPWKEVKRTWWEAVATFQQFQCKFIVLTIIIDLTHLFIFLLHFKSFQKGSDILHENMDVSKCLTRSFICFFSNPFSINYLFCRVDSPHLRWPFQSFPILAIDWLFNLKFLLLSTFRRTRKYVDFIFNVTQRHSSSSYWGYCVLTHTKDPFFLLYFYFFVVKYYKVKFALSIFVVLSKLFFALQ